MIERKIVIGLITSTEFIQQIQSIWDVKLLDSAMAKRIAGWCMSYFKKYNKAPGKDIEAIYYRKLKEGLSDVLAEEIEQDILPELSDEYENEKFNLDYLLDQTRLYLKEKRLYRFCENIKDEIEDGKLTEAEKIALDYQPPASSDGADLDLSNKEESFKRVEKAFKEASEPIIRYPRQLGQFWNEQLIRGGFVALMASEKRGKSYWLLEMAKRATRQKAKVAFFQAGDMTENQQIRRLCIHLTKNSDKAQYCGKMYQPIRDCVKNQTNTCDLKIRECDFGVFEGHTEEEIRKTITLKELVEQYKENPDYKTCHNCNEYKSKKLGAVWIEEVEVKSPLSVKRAQEAVDDFFIKNKRKFKLATYANDTLTIKEIKSMLNIWEKTDGFIPDLIIVDYADLLVPDDNKQDFRHQQNKIWKGLRNLSQEKHCLLVTVTQADAKSYEQDRLRLSNFSEDKRKYAHVTAMYGLNQDKKGREKKLGLMVINELVIREGDFANTNEVRVLQNLKRGQPYLGSFW